MKSICIKSLDLNCIDSLNKFFKIKSFEHTKIRLKNFKIYYNLIIHYCGEENNKFLYTVSNYVSEYIVLKYEDLLIKRCIKKNYFYFDEFEKEVIFNISKKILELQKNEFEYKNEILTEIIYDLLLNNKKFYIDGIINFRIKEYMDILEYLIEISVMNYLKFV